MEDRQRLTMLALLDYQWGLVDYDYEKLSQGEKDRVTKAEFEDLLDTMGH